MNSSTATILIVDDEVKNRTLLAALLRSEGYLMTSAAGGQEALALIAQQAPDLILLDVMMPGMDGYQLAGLLKADPATANIPIIMVSAKTDRSARLAGLDAGAEEFLTKPVDRAELWLRVRNLLRLKELSDFFQNHARILEQQVQARTTDLQRFRSAMDATADAIFLTNRRTMRFVELNATACTMLGYTREELFELGPTSFSAMTLEALESTDDALIAGDGANRMSEALMRRKNGSEVQVEVHRQVQRFGDDWIIVDVLRDITELKRIDRMKTEFVSTVSHELRTPLTSIRGSLGLIDGGVAGEVPKAVKNLVGIAKNNCERLIRLINDILDNEKIESGKLRLDLQVVDIKQLVAQALAANEGFAGQHSVTLLLQAPDEPLQVRIDSDRLTQVVTNLLSNAVKFSPPQSAVEVTVSRVGQQVRVEVADHGPGIPEEFRSRIFQKFSQADASDARQKGGTGLGLSISRALIEKMGGQIGFSSEAGAGTTFFFELPEWQNPVPLQPVRTQAVLSRPHILVCEGDARAALHGAPMLSLT